MADAPPDGTASVDAIMEAAQVLAQEDSDLDQQDENDEIDEVDEIDDTRSSSLSDIEDNQEDEVGAQAEEEMSLHHPAADDSEAETERLHDSPSKVFKSRKMSLHVPFERSPSKLANTDLATGGDVEVDSESGISSPGSSDVECLSVGSDDEEPEREERELSLSVLKRKRAKNSASDSDEEDHRARKRTGSIKSELNVIETASDEGNLSEQEIEPAEDIQDDQIAEVAEVNVEIQLQEDIQAVEEGQPTSIKKSKSKKSKAKPRRTRADVMDGRPLVDNREETEDDDALEDEEDAEATARTEEEVAKRSAAMEALAALEKNFAMLRDRLYDEKIAALNQELAQLTGDKPTHPEYLRQLEAIEKYRNDKWHFEQHSLVFKVEALKRKSQAERAQLHSSYIQHAGDMRESKMEECARFFYQIQRDRFKTDDNMPIYTIPYPTQRAKQVLQQQAYNKEVSILSGIAKHVGFPAAPSMAPATTADIEDDLDKMGVSRLKVSHRHR